MSYLVSGGAGFIGSHVAERLLRRGETVIILDNFNDYYDPALKHHNIARIQHPKLKVIKGDVRDAELVNFVYREHGITHVVHLAAMANVRFSADQTPLYTAVNYMGTMNMLEAARELEVEQFVLASTSSVYGLTDHIPFVEDDPCDRPLASYPASKRGAEILAHTYWHLFGMNVTVLRFFNVYGPAGRPDQMPWRLMQAAADGTVIPLFNGGDIARDWTYIDDTVDGVMAALDRPLGYEIINLGLGAPISMRDFVELIEEYSGRKIKTNPVPTPATDPPITYCNNDKARDLLDFDPQIRVETGLKWMWEWFRQYQGI